jgi:hypothetical protein
MDDLDYKIENCKLFLENLIIKTKNNYDKAVSSKQKEYLLYLKENLSVVMELICLLPVARKEIFFKDSQIEYLKKTLREKGLQSEYTYKPKPDKETLRYDSIHRSNILDNIY